MQLLRSSSHGWHTAAALPASTSPGALITCLLCLLALVGPVPQAGVAETFSIDGKTIEGEIVDLVEDGVFVAVDASGEVVPWDRLSSFQAKDVRTTMIEPLRNLRAGAVWVIGTVRDVLPQGAVIFADARPRANYGGEFNVPARDEAKAQPRKIRAGAPAVSGWYLIPDLPDARSLVGETVQLIAYPNGNTEEVQLNEETDAEEIPTATIALPPWAGVRKWTNSEGITIEAELVYVHNGNCIFEKEGTTMAYPLAKLIPKDQEIVQICEDMARQVFIDPIALQ